jgi:phage terminase large subunit
LEQNRSNPAIKDRVNAVNNMLQSAAGTRRIVIHPRCKELIKDFRQVRWQRDSAGNPTGEIDKSDTDRTHLSDALSYMMVREFGMRPMGGPRSEVIA